VKRSKCLRDIIYSRREQTGLFDKQNHFEKPQRGDINIAWGNAPGNPSYAHVEYSLRKASHRYTQVFWTPCIPDKY
jgi:hypothetical protein